MNLKTGLNLLQNKSQNLKCKTKFMIFMLLLFSKTHNLIYNNKEEVSINILCFRQFNQYPNKIYSSNNL